MNFFGNIGKKDRASRFRTAIACLFFMVVASGGYGQSAGKDENRLGWEVGLEGMLGFAAGNDFYAFNVGGPSLLLQVHRHWKVGVGALPSFYVKEGKSGAKLGVSPRIDFKNLVLIVPFFHFDQSDTWVWSVGLGYKFHKKK